MSQIIESRYMLGTEAVATGVFGTVCRARDTHLARDVAIKELEGVHAADGEVSVMARYGKSQHLPYLLDAFSAGARAYVVMEWIQGDSFKDHMRCERLAPREAIALIMGVLGALRDLHDAGVLHLDVQPKNIIHRGFGHVHLVDLGTAEAMDDDGAWTGPVSGGTWEFMPPEQFAKRPRLDRSADLYAAISVLAYLLTGEAPFRPPFDNEGANAGDYRAGCGDPGERRRRRSSLPHLCGCPALEPVFRRGLSTEPSKRFKSARELMDALSSLKLERAIPEPSSD